MGICKAHKPMCPKECVIPYASFHPASQGLQHALCPHRMFYPSPLYRIGFSRLFIPARAGHSLGAFFIRCIHCTSTFLHPFAPRALPRFFAPTSALTPAQGALRTLTKGNEHPPCPEQVSLIPRTRPSMHSVTNHLARPVIAYPLPDQRDRLPDLNPGLDFALGLRAHRYARPNRVRHPTDCMFASGCSPPHLAAAQLPLATRKRASPGEGTFTPQIASALRRTVPRQSRGFINPRFFKQDFS